MTRLMELTGTLEEINIRVSEILLSQSAWENWHCVYAEHYSPATKEEGRLWIVLIELF